MENYTKIWMDGSPSVTGKNHAQGNIALGKFQGKPSTVHYFRAKKMLDQTSVESVFSQIRSHLLPIIPLFQREFFLNILMEILRIVF